MKVMGHIAGLFLGLSALTPALAADEPGCTSFGPGEQTQYRIQYLGMNAGSANLTVGAPTQQWGKEVWPIVAIAKSEALGIYPIKDKFVSYWEASTQRVIGSDLFADENRRRRRQRIKMEPSGTKAQVMKQKEGERPNESTHDVVVNSFDIAGATFALRNQDLQVGKEYAFPIFTGTKSFMLRAKVDSKETLQTPMGKREAFKVRVQTDFSGKLQSKRDITAYLSTESGHVPLRLEADFVVGTIVAELTEYKRGRTLAAQDVPQHGG